MTTPSLSHPCLRCACNPPRRPCSGCMLPANSRTRNAHARGGHQRSRDCGASMAVHAITKPPATGARSSVCTWMDRLGHLSRRARNGTTWQPCYSIATTISGLPQRLRYTSGCEFESRRGHDRCISQSRKLCSGGVASGTHFRRAVRRGRMSTPTEAGEAFTCRGIMK